MRLNTANPPSSERRAQEYLAALLDTAGLETALLGEDQERPNLVARLRGYEPGPVLGLLSHVDRRRRPGRLATRALVGLAVDGYRAVATGLLGDGA